jgi:hypothetical protein
MRTSFIYGLIAAVITYIFMWLDDRLFDSKKSKATYFKNMFFVGFLVAGGVYFLGEDIFDDALSSGSKQFGSGYGGGGYFNGYGEEIMTGNPNF